jgi:hypothetical protein
MKKSKQEIYMDCLSWAQQYYLQSINFTLSKENYEKRQDMVLKVADRYYKEIIKKS